MIDVTVLFSSYVTFIFVKMPQSVAKRKKRKNTTCFNRQLSEQNQLKHVLIDKYFFILSSGTYRISLGLLVILIVPSLHKTVFIVTQFSQHMSR